MDLNKYSSFDVLDRPRHSVFEVLNIDRPCLFELIESITRLSYLSCIRSITVAGFLSEAERLLTQIDDYERSVINGIKALDYDVIISGDIKIDEFTSGVDRFVQEWKTFRDNFLMLVLQVDTSKEFNERKCALSLVSSILKTYNPEFNMESVLDDIVFICTVGDRNELCSPEENLVEQARLAAQRVYHKLNSAMAVVFSLEDDGPTQPELLPLAMADFYNLLSNKIGV